jgi:kumamolisin
VLSVRTDGAYFAEAGWEEFLSTRASGGGINPSESRPAWQRGPGVDHASSNGRRQVPDVAAAAGDDSPYQIYYTPGDGTAPWTTASGTSAAAPFWAGVALLLREVAQHEGVGRLGYLNPMLYDLAAGDRTRAVFHDVTVGGNLLHQATPGWDDATGLGSPDVTALARAIVAWLRDHPA